MGDRINHISTDGEDRSPILYAHWMGLDLLESAKRSYKECIASNECRCEPANVPVNIISHVRKGGVRDGEVYAGPKKRGE